MASQSIRSVKLAVVAAAVSEDPRQGAKLARQMGFSGMLFSAAAGGIDLAELSQTGRREFRHILGTQEQQLVGLSVDLGGIGFGPEADVDRILDRLERVMDAARGLLASLVCIDIGPLPPAPVVVKPKPTITPEMAGMLVLPIFTTAAPAPEVTSLPHLPPAVDPTFAAQVDAALFELGQRADRYGVMLAMRSDLAPYSALEHALGRVNCPWFGIDLDPVAMLRDDWATDEVFSRLGNLIRHVRARDGLRGADRRTKATVIGQGNVDWPTLLANFDAAGYSGWLTVDSLELADRSAAAVAAAKHLKDAAGK